MVKAVFSAVYAIRAAKTSEDAYNAAIEFIASPDAFSVNRGQAGTFLKDVETAFLNFPDPDPKRYQMFLAAIQAPKSQASYDLQELALWKQAEFAGVREQAAVLNANAHVLMRAREQQPA
jgi:hypothetical protein